MKILKIVSTFLFVTAFILYCTGCAAHGGETIATVVTTAPSEAAAEAPAETEAPGEAAKAVAEVLGRPEFADFRVEDIFTATLDTRVGLDDRWTSGDTEALWAAIQADCEAGRLDPQKSHAGSFHFADGKTSLFYDGPHEGDDLRFTLWGGDPEHLEEFAFQIFPDCENVLKILNDRGLLEEYGISVK